MRLSGMVTLLTIRHMALFTGRISRRAFLQRSAMAVGGLVVSPFTGGWQPKPDERLGRVNVGMVERKKGPDPDSPTLGPVYEDTVVPWLREVVGRRPFRFNQRWVETPDGYIWTPYLQPVQNVINTPVSR